MELPGWLCENEDYEPVRDRAGFLRKNVFGLMGLLRRIHLGGSAGAGSFVDRALERVSAPVRLTGLLACVVMVCCARGGLFLAVMMLAVLANCAVRPERALKATLVPALGAALFALILALPAVVLGVSAAAAMVRIALKTFVNVLLVLGVSCTVPWNRLAGALKVLRLPDVVIFTVDMALKHIEILGRVSMQLSEALELRCVGRAPRGSHTTGMAGVMGATFLRAYACGNAMSEAMTCRGFSGTYPRPAWGWRLTRADVVYALALIVLIVLFVAL